MPEETKIVAPEEKKKEEFKKIKKKIFWGLGLILAGLLTTLGGYAGNSGIKAYESYEINKHQKDSLVNSIGLMWSYTQNLATEVDSLKSGLNQDRIDDGRKIVYVAPIEIKSDTSITNFPSKLKEEIQRTRK